MTRGRFDVWAPRPQRVRLSVGDEVAPMRRGDDGWWSPEGSVPEGEADYGYLVDDGNFRNRFDTEPWTLSHKRHQRDGSYWDRASLRDRYDAIRIPTFHIGGWYDGYRDSVPRMLEHVKNAPVKGMVGAWPWSEKT